MLNKNLKFNYGKISTETFLFFTSSSLFFLFSKIFYVGITEPNILSIILFSFVVFFGLPNGALDTLIAKKFKIYNNFYEFGTDKGDPYAYAHELTTEPWTVEVSGEAKKVGKYGIEDILKGLTVEDRVYRFRCVEAWSMVVPWQGVPLKKVLDQFEPTGNAKYVEFKTLYRPSEMRGQRSFFSNIDWPYVEGLRLDEAYHPLSIMVTGVYGKK